MSGRTWMLTDVPSREPPTARAQSRGRASSDDLRRSARGYLTEPGAEALVELGAMLVGIDSVNIDDTTTGDRPAHTCLLAAGIPIVEHLTGLADLPTTGARFTAVPPAVRGLATFPVRAFASVPND